MQAELEMKRQELEFKREELDLKRQEAQLKLRASQEAAQVKAQEMHAMSSMKLGVAAQTSKMQVDHTKELHKVKQQQEKRNAPRRSR